MNEKKGFCLWFTGLSGAGKSTVSNAVHHALQECGIANVEMLDGDEVRTHLTKGLGFSREDRDTNVLRIGWVCRLLVKHGIPVMTAAISPYCETRSNVGPWWNSMAARVRLSRCLSTPVWKNAHGAM